jgi:hypothetical protein
MKMTSEKAIFAGSSGSWFAVSFPSVMPVANSDSNRTKPKIAGQTPSLISAFSESKSFLRKFVMRSVSHDELSAPTDTLLVKQLGTWQA